MQYKLITLITRDLSDWIRGQGTKAKARPRPNLFEVKAKAMIYCLQAVPEVEDSPRGPHPWYPMRTRATV